MNSPYTKEELKKLNTPLLCPECLCMTAVVKPEDNDYNLSRMKEVTEGRSNTEPLIFNFRASCSTCGGHVYLPKIISNVKFE